LETVNTAELRDRFVRWYSRFCEKYLFFVIEEGTSVTYMPLKMLDVRIRSQF